MRKKLLGYILLALIIMIVIVSIIIMLLIKNNNKLVFWDYTNKDDDNVILEKEQETYLIINKILYFSIRDNVLQQYINSIQNKNSEAVYNMLSAEFKQKNEITNDNVLSKLPNYKITKIYTQHMYMKEGDFSDNVYISAIVQNSTIKENYEMETENIEQYFKVILDKRESTFSIEPINEKIYSQGVNNELEEDNTSIEKNTHNVFEYIAVTDDYVVEKYLDNYINLLKNNTQRAYEIIEEEYKNKKYNNNYSNFEKSLNMDILPEVFIESYEKIFTENNNVKYICKDQFGNIYIFNEIAVMEYTVELDSYTLENAELNEKYSNLSKKQKVEYNINKFFEMIRTQDYSKAYAVLDETFKNEKFPTQESFEKYVKNELYRYNEIDDIGYADNVSSVYICTMRLTDATGQEVDEINFSIVMRLLEETDFKMSFSK